MNFLSYDENRSRSVRTSSSSNSNQKMMKKRSPSERMSAIRKPLSSLDKNCSFKKTTESSKKKSSIGILLLEKKSPMVVDLEDNNDVIIKEGDQKKEERDDEEELIKQLIDGASSNDIFRPSLSFNDKTSDFWDDEMESMLMLHLANPIYESDSDSDVVHVDDYQLHSANIVYVHDEGNQIESKLENMILFEER